MDFTCDLIESDELDDEHLTNSDWSHCQPACMEALHTGHDVKASTPKPQG